MSEQQTEYETDAEHTPAPWRVRHGYIESTAETNEVHIQNIAAILAPSKRHVDEADANAKLIAAAPDLLEAARWAREHVDHPKALAVIDEAIVKARGNHK